MTSDLKEYDVRAHLIAYWLRSESIVWHCIAARYLSRALKLRSDFVEVGIENGFLISFYFMRSLFYRL